MTIHAKRSKMVKCRLVARKQHYNKSFIKPIISDSFHKLLIPKAFLKHISGGKAVLRSHGNCWHVKIDGGESFQEGWKEFVDDHDLSVGDILMFKHQGNLVFDVIVFDKSACEKKCTSFAEEVDRMNGEDEESSDESHREYLKKTKHLNKRGGTCFLNQRAAQAASSYTTQYPHFRATIVPSNLLPNKPYVNIPSTFFEWSGLKKWTCEYNLTLKDSEGRAWPVKLGHRIKGNRICIGTGWYQFAKSNNLGEGDECIFELISSKKRKSAILNVLIFR